MRETGAGMLAEMAAMKDGNEGNAGEMMQRWRSREGRKGGGREASVERRRCAGAPSRRMTSVWTVRWRKSVRKAVHWRAVGEGRWSAEDDERWFWRTRLRSSGGERAPGRVERNFWTGSISRKSCHGKKEPIKPPRAVLCSTTSAPQLIVA